MKTVVLLSGGLDSAVVLAMKLAEGDDVLALTIDYRQNNDAELAAASKLCELWGVPHHKSTMFLARRDARECIPARNTLFLAKALELAIVEGADCVAYGAEPDSRYADSSERYIGHMQNVFDLHGVKLVAPVKLLEDKLDVLKTALDLGVPLHLVHSSRSNARAGCTTSSRTLTALQSLFPNINPIRLLDLLADAHGQEQNPFDVRTMHTGSFKFFPALFVLAQANPTVTHSVVTTGNWGASLQWVNEHVFDGMFKLDVAVVTTGNITALRSSSPHCSAQAGQWGTKQALSRLPRPRYLGAPLSCPVVQGDLKWCLTDLGYRVSAEGLKLVTGHMPKAELELPF